MSLNGQSLLELLPAIYRIRDVEIAQDLGLEDDQGPLASVMDIIAREFALLEENIEQSYDDLFIETCAEKITPYIGDLIGYQSLHSQIPEIEGPRAEIAHTIALRRRKGTAVVLEQLARDVTRWPARVVEFFQQLGWTQNTNHLRDFVAYSPHMKNHEALFRIGGAFNTSEHTIDVRRVANTRGKFNIPNIGIFIWRIKDYTRTMHPALRLDARRYFCSPLGHNLNLFSKERTVDTGIITEASTPENIPEPLARRQLHDWLNSYYGIRQSAGDPEDNNKPSIVLYIDGNDIARDQVRVCNLSDDGAAWAHELSDGLYGIDPVLGRVILPTDVAEPATVHVSYHTGFSSSVGGGEYEREDEFSLPQSELIISVPDDATTIQDAIDELLNQFTLNAEISSGVVEIKNSERFIEALNVHVPDSHVIEIRAENGNFPHLQLSSNFIISGGNNSELHLNGLLISHASLEVPNLATNVLSSLNIAHCTLVPGLSLNADGTPQTNQASIIGAQSNVHFNIERTISGALRINPECFVNALDSIIDATDKNIPALTDLDGDSPGAVFSALQSTVIGKLHVRAIELVSNSILFAGLSPGDTWSAAVWVERKQTGCIRFSFLPFNSIVPKRHQCQPQSQQTALSVSPQFTSLRYGTPGYCQLIAYARDEIFRGADDESEMGVFHHLYAPQRETNLKIRLREYLRVGLEAGIFYEN